MDSCPRPRRPADRKGRWPSPFQALRSQKGVAMLIAMFAFTLLSFIAIEVAYDTSVDQVVSSQQVNRVRAYYAAKAGVEISLLRVMLYKQAIAAFGDTLGANKSLLDPIWAFPFAWPPAIGEDTKMTGVEKSMLGDSVKESIMVGQYATTITPEGGRLDINDLGSPVKLLRQAMKVQIIKIFQAELENNENFSDEYRGFNFEEVVNNISDYIDEDSDGQNGGDESGGYRDIDDKEIKMPPNRPLRTLDELHQVAGMNDTFFNILLPRITIFGTKGINVNYAPKEVLKYLEITMTDEAVGKVIERRNDPKLGGPFKDDADFLGFIRNYGVNTKAIEDSKVTLLYDVEFNFRIVSTGVSSNVQREITAITYDYDNLTDRLGQMMDKQDQENSGQQQQQQQQQQQNQQTPTGQQNQQQNQQAKIKGAKGRPTVVYWEEN